MGQLWIMGCGDIGRRVASLYQNEGRQAIGWVRSEESLLLGQQVGIRMHMGDLDQGDFSTKTELQDSDIFWFMPPPRQGTQDTRLSRFLKRVEGAPRRIVLISTTGVYGDCQGRWIDEDEPLKPDSDRAHRRVDAEATLKQWGEEFAGDWVILRVPGIYAQDRLPLARLRRGEPVLRIDEAPWTNRIHADDLALVCKIAMDTALSGSIYNATDGHPSTMTDYFNQVADFAGLPRPPQVSMADAKQSMSAGMLSYLVESRRIRNTKLLTELAVQFAYPSLKDALRK